MRRTSYPRTVLSAGTLVLFALHLARSSLVSGPTVMFDENGYLGTARWLAGGQTWEMPFAPFYSAAYSLLIAPATMLSDDPGTQWLGIRMIDSVLLAALLPLLFLVLKRVFGASDRHALAGSAIGALIPAIFSAGISATAENLVFPVVVLFVLAAHDLVRPVSAARRMAFGLTVGLLYATHPRFSLLVPLTVVGLMWLAIRRRDSRTIAVANIALLAVVVGAATLLNAMARSQRWSEVEQLEGGVSDWSSLFLSPNGWKELLATATGQLWYLAVGSIGLGLVGFAVVAHQAWQGRYQYTGNRFRIPEVSAPLILVTAAVAVFATSVVFFSQNQFRADHYVYGRHNDSFATIWVAVAAAHLLFSRRRPRPATLLVGAGAVTACSGVLLMVMRDPLDLDGSISVFAAPALALLAEPVSTRTFANATALALVGIAMLGAAQIVRKSRAASLLVPLTLFGALALFVYTGAEVVGHTSEFHGFVYDSWRGETAVEDLGVEEMCIDQSVGGGRPNLMYGWMLPRVDVRSYRSSEGEGSSCALTLAGPHDDDQIRQGDGIVGLDDGVGYPWATPGEALALWLAPGPALDDLARRGAVLPSGFPSPLPESARSADIRIEGPLEVASIRSGKHTSLAATVRHTGDGSPWPDQLSWSWDGHVQLLAAFTPLGTDEQTQFVPAGSIPRWMIPGDSEEATVRLVAVDEGLQPLAPGRYHVVLGIGQQGYDWFEPAGIEMELEVSR